MTTLIAPVSYRVIYLDFDGNIISDIPFFFKLEFTKQESDRGYLYLDIPNVYSKDYFKIDGRIEVYRKIGYGVEYLELDTQWLIRKVTFKTDESGKSVIHILAYDLNDILFRRIIAYASGTSYVKKTGACDNVIFEILRENFGSLAVDTARDLSSYLVIPENFTTSLCPSITTAFAWQEVFPLIKEICDYSISSGVYLTFDVVKLDRKRFGFYTYAICRGINRGTNSNKSLYFSLDRGNLSYASLSRDHSEERNFIYAGGQGEEDSRIIKTYANSSAISLSPYNRYEEFVDATSDPSPDYVQSQAQSNEMKSRAKIVVNSHIQQVQDCLYGLHYFFGDIVVIEHGGYTVDTHLDTVHIICSDSGSEEVTIYGRNMEDTDY